MLKKSGVTLIELLMVIAIVVTLAGLVTVNFIRSYQAHNVKYFTNELAAYLRYVQFKAIEEGAVHKLTTDPESGGLESFAQYGKANEFQEITTPFSRRFGKTGHLNLTLKVLGNGVPIRTKGNNAIGRARNRSCFDIREGELASDFLHIIVIGADLNDVTLELSPFSAKLQESQENLRFKETKRLAELEIRQVLTQWEWAVKRRQALAEAVAAAQENYSLQTEDYRLSLVNNLEVLDALEQLQETRRDFGNVDNELMRLYFKYKIAIGEPAL